MPDGQFLTPSPMQSQEVHELFTALVKAQASIGSAPKNRTVSVKTKTGGSYDFAYTTFDEIIELVREPLTNNGLWFIQRLANGDSKYRLVTTLVHQSGQWISSETPLLVQGTGNQEFGSALTYMKRYALAAMLGIASDDDDDANAADGNSVQKRQDRKPANGSKPPPASAPKAAPQEARAYYDPETGETWPCHIPVPIARDGEGSDWQRWVETLLTQGFGASKTLEELTAGKEANKPSIDSLEAVNATLHETVVKAYKNKYRVLGGK